MMIDFTIINRSKKRSLLLVHGLFASAGFWLPYLRILKEYRLIVLDIDYRDVSKLDDYLFEIEEIVVAEAEGVVDAVVSHSLGTLLAGLLPNQLRKSSFEICPVHSAKRCSYDKFVEDVQRKIGPKITKEQIEKQLQSIDSLMANHKASLIKKNGRSVYVPETDQYFEYANQRSAKKFNGGHFEIENALLHMVELI